MQYTCKQCGIKFTAYHKKRTTCSKKCSALFQSKRITKLCEMCQKPITRSLGNFGYKKAFCDRTCQHRWESLNNARFLTLRDKNWCLEQYKTKSLLKIAQELRCGETTVYKYFNRHGIELDRRKWLLSVPKSEEHKKKLSEFRLGRFKGEDNPNWQGGITKLHTRIRTSLKYNTWREAVKKINKSICVLCGATERLEVDHIKQFRFIVSDNNVQTLEDAINCKELWDINNGRIVCRFCNIKREKS